MGYLLDLPNADLGPWVKLLLRAAACIRVAEMAYMSDLTTFPKSSKTDMLCSSIDCCREFPAQPKLHRDAATRYESYRSHRLLLAVQKLHRLTFFFYSASSGYSLAQIPMMDCFSQCKSFTGEPFNSASSGYSLAQIPMHDSCTSILPIDLK
jgi:hypothetical protein